MSAAHWKEEAVFRANFDGSADAVLSLGDPRIYSAPDYSKADQAQPGLPSTSVELAPDEGIQGGALRFVKPNKVAVFYKGLGNVPFEPKNWTGTLSLWLRLDPQLDLEKDYCDPIQLTDKAYNDSAIWVDFTKDGNPKPFRLGIFGSLKEWNPNNKNPESDPTFDNRLVAIPKPEFSRERWTHIAIVFQGLGSGSGDAHFYMNGTLRGKTEQIKEAFSWDMGRGSIRLAFNYAGYMDEIALFKRALTNREVMQILKAKGW